jgi:hypothetical protein
MRLLSKLLFAFIVITHLISCGEKSAIKEETLYFQDENKGWLTSDSTGYNFIMIDNNGISQSYTKEWDTYEFSKSWGSFLGVNTEMTHAEYHYQPYYSSYGTPYSLSLSAGFEPFGDGLHIKLGEIEFDYDLKHKTISSIYINTETKSKLMTDKGYEVQGEDILSTVNILYSYSTDYHNYDTVLHFQLGDFKNTWEDFTITDIYVAKNNGLVSYKLHNGIFYVRK